MAVLELYKETPEQVILKINITDPLTAAENSWLNADWEYITITRGNKHIMRFIKKDLSNWSIQWGDGGCTCISDGLLETKRKIIDFVENKCHILLDYAGQPIERATIFYNSYFGAWQLTLAGRTPSSWTACYWDDTVHNVEEMKISANRFVDTADWVYKVAQTGIDTWEGVLI
jgi:hypothetical protein